MCSNGSSIEPGKKRTRISTWHERKSTQKLFAILVALGAQGLAYAQGAPAAPGTVTHAVDAQIFKGPKEIADAGRGPRPLAAVADAKGVVSRFIADEVIFRGSSSDLTAFLAKHSGKVISTIEPAKSPTGVAPRPGVPPQPASVIRLDPTNFSAQNLDADSGKLGLKGAVKFSSSQGESLAAIAASELAKGSKVSLNFVSEGHDFLYSTQEQGDADAFTWTEFDHRAWQFIAEHGITRRVKLAIVDGGFWLDSSGKPFPDANGRSDLPAQPIQHDAITQGPFAGGSNPNTCTGGNPCPWHGHRSASVALATLNNQAGAAGMGGQVADPILLKVDGTDDTAMGAMLTAWWWGADIISMSFGEDCNDWCKANHDLGGMDGDMNNILNSGVLMVASAGNNAVDAGDTWPCYYSSDAGNKIYCVGALNPATGDTAASFSNYGIVVNIWAPTNIHAMPDGGSAGALTTHGGTSASCPYVAGVAAMMKAIDPTLDANHLKNLIGNAPYIAGTARLMQNDPKVDMIVEPYPAVVAAAGGYHLKPDLRITAPQNGAIVQIGSYQSVQFTAFAADVNDGPWPVAGHPVTWTSDVDGQLLDGTSMAFDFTLAPLGLRHITASVTNTAGETTSQTIAITTVFTRVTPSPVITWPPPNTTVAPGTYWLTGYAKSTDPGQLGNFSCDRLVFNGSLPAQPVPNSNGLCRAQVTLNAGVQQISLAATDKFGDKGTTTVSLTVQSTAADLSVQILNPLPGTLNRVIFGNQSTISLSGNAAPTDAYAYYSWYWYLTGAGVTTKQPIANGLRLTDTTWQPQTGVCGTSTGIFGVTLRLEVVDSPPMIVTPHYVKPQPPPVVSRSGVAEESIIVSCERVQ